MRVLHVHDKHRGLGAPVEPSAHPREFGGLETYVDQVAGAQRAAGAEVSVLRLWVSEGERGEVGEGSFEYPALRQVAGAGARRGLRAVVAEARPHVIHLHSVYYALTSRAVAELGRAWPVVNMFHDVTPICFRRDKLRPDGALCERPAGPGCLLGGCFRLTSSGGWKWNAARLITQSAKLGAYRALPATVVPSRYLANELIRNALDSDRIRVLPLFSRFSPDAPAAPPADGPVVFLGRLTPEKGVMHFVHALARVRDRAWTARIVGDGPLGEQVAMEVARLGLAGRITLEAVAEARRIEAIYRDAAFIVFPSLVPESFGLVGVEAQSFGRAVVSYGAGGSGEWLADGVNGLRAAHGDVADLARQIARLLDDPPLRERLGAAGAEQVRKRLSRDTHTAKLDAVYRSVIDGTPLPDG